MLVLIQLPTAYNTIAPMHLFSFHLFTMIPVLEKVGKIIHESTAVVELDKDVHVHVQVVSVTCGDCTDWCISDCCATNPMEEEKDQLNHPRNNKCVLL
jgi:hypothetical protein